MLLDTDILIDLQRGHPPALAWIATLPMRPWISGFAAMEFIAGARNRPEQQRSQRFLRPFPVLWPTQADLARLGRLCTAEIGTWHRPY